MSYIAPQTIAHTREGPRLRTILPHGEAVPEARTFLTLSFNIGRLYSVRTRTHEHCWRRGQTHPDGAPASYGQCMAPPPPNTQRRRGNKRYHPDHPPQVAPRAPRLTF